MLRVTARSILFGGLIFLCSAAAGLPARAQAVPHYTLDPSWPKVEAALHGGPAPTFTYHRFLAQTDIALANATFAILYPNGIKTAAASGGKPKPAKAAKGKGRKK